MRRKGVSLKTLAATVLFTTAALALAPGAWAYKYKVLHKFPASGHSTYSTAGLTLDANGNLYGTTEFGGAYGNGRVYELTPNPDGSWTEKDLYSFTHGADGGQPWAGVIFDAVGNLYGTTGYGGAGDCSDTYGSGCGTVFELTPNPDGSWTEATLYSFTGSDDGGSPRGSLIFDFSGNLYGTTEYGGSGRCDGLQVCGTVFELTPNPDGSWTESVLHSFMGATDGEKPRSALTFDSAGNLYGVTYAGGNCINCGTVFELTPNPDGSWTENVLHKFTGDKDGQQPWAGPLIFDAQGNLYGTAEWGGSYGFGTVFKLTPSGDGTWKGTVLHSFTKGGDGAWPVSGLAFDAAGNLYGEAGGGGAHGYGLVFEATPDPGGRWQGHVLHAFAGQPGTGPVSARLLDGAGNVYGVSHANGYESVVFEVTP